MAGELLSQELETVAWSESILALEAEAIAQSDFSRLAKDYRRLLKDLQRILRMSDRNELRLQKVSDELKLEKKRFEDIATRLSSYLPRQVYDSIFQGTQSFEIKSQRKLLTIFFSDIQGFTKISEALQPERLTSLINEYFSEMSAIAIQYGGTIDKFIGDAVMIFFGDPESKGHQKDALLADGGSHAKAFERAQYQMGKRGADLPIDHAHGHQHRLVHGRQLWQRPTHVLHHHWG
jgi:class 3 adenylate cyclase